MLKNSSRPYNLLTLQFHDKELEQQFGDYILATYRSTFQLALFLGSLLYGGFIFVDYFIHYPDFGYFLGLRLSLSIFLFICFFLTFSKRVNSFKYLGFLVILSVSCAQLGHFGLSFSASVHDFYYLLITSVLWFFGCTITRLPFKFSPYLGLFIIVSFAYHIFGQQSFDTSMIIYQVIVLLTTLITGFLANYTIEQNRRLDFLNHQLIKDQEDELLQQNEDLQELIKKLDQRNNEIQQFNYIASHDLKTPMRGIANLIQFIEEDIPQKALTKDTQSYFKLIQERINRLYNLLDGISIFSNSDAKVSYTSILLSPFLEELKTEFSNYSNAKIQIQKSLPEIFVNADELRQIFYQLLDNALEHSDQINPEIQIFERKDHLQTCICVEDNGPGISEKNQKNIFSLFRSSIDQRDGLGIGLPIVKKILTKYNGEIMLEITDQGSCRFVLFFPKKMNTQMLSY